MRKSRTTLQDIADKVGVTKMTVSRYLRDPDRVSGPLGEQIIQVAEELGYIPSRAPDILSKARSHSIGVLVPSLGNQVFEEVIKGIEQITEAQGYQTMLAHYGYSKRKEEQRIETLLSYHVDGIILSESRHSERAKRMLQAAGIPVIEIMDSVLPPLQQAVGFDNQKASEMMTEQLIARGRKNILYFAAKMDQRARQKVAGYSRVMALHGLEPVTLSAEASSSYSAGASLMQQALSEYPELDAVYCTNDVLASGALFECLRQGIKVPEQIAVAGFHGSDIAATTSPKLASVVTPRQEIGRIAAEKLLLRINQPEEPLTEQVIELPVKLSLGESV